MAKANSNTVETIKFDMVRLQKDHGEAVRVKVGSTLTLVYQKNGTKKENAIKEMVALANTYPEYVTDWGIYKSAQSNTNKKSNIKESEMKEMKTEATATVEVIDVDVVDVETVVADEATTGGMDAAAYQEFLEYQEFRAWKAQKEREQYARRPIDQSTRRIENKAVFTASPLVRQPEVKFVSPADILKAQVFIKGQVAKVVHEAEKAYFMSCEWRGSDTIAEAVEVDLSGLMQPVTEERGLAIAKSAFENALRGAMHDRFGSGWEYQLESAGVVNPLTVAKAVFRML